MKLPAALLASVCIISATVLSLHEVTFAAAAIAVLGLCVWLSDVGSNMKPTP